MNRYWDLSEKDRSELTQEQVESLLTVELMEKGVVKVEPPIKVQVEEISPPSLTLFCVKAGYRDPGCGYMKAEDAAEAARNAVALDYDYIGGVHYNKLGKGRDVEITPVQVYTPEELQLQRAKIERNNAAKAANTKADEEYKAACKAVEDACSGVWDDWFEQRSTRSRYERIVKTYKEYLTTCDGNEEIAFKFLRKAYLDPEIALALEWFGVAVVAEAV